MSDTCSWLLRALGVWVCACGCGHSLLFRKWGLERSRSRPAEQSLPRWLYSRLRATTLARSGGGRWKVVVEVKWLCCVCVSVVYVRVFAPHCAVHFCARHAYTYRRIAQRHWYARQT